MSGKKIRVCNSRSCTAFGAKRIMHAIERATGLHAGERNEQYDIDYCGCLGWCSNSPNVEVNDHRMIMDADPDTIMQNIRRENGTPTPPRDIHIPLTDDFLGDI